MSTIPRYVLDSHVPMPSNQPKSTSEPGTKSLLKQQLLDKAEADAAQRQKDLAEYAGILRKVKRTQKDIERLDALVKALGYTPDTVELHATVIDEVAALQKAIAGAQSIEDELAKVQADSTAIADQINALFAQDALLKARGDLLSAAIEERDERKEHLEALTATFLPLFGETTWNPDNWRFRAPFLPANIVIKAQSLGVLKPHGGLPGEQLRMQ